MPRPTSSAPVSDEWLVGSALDGDRGAFAVLVDRYQRPVRAGCLAVLRDHQLAEDAAQDAFVAAYRSLTALRDRSSFGPWVLNIARNRAMRLARERSRRQVVHDAARVEWRPPPPENVETDEALLTAIAALPDHERSVVMLRYFGGHDVTAIAAMTGRPVGTVTKQLSRAHERLRKALTRQEDL